MSITTTNTMRLSEKVMDSLWQRSAAITDNISNAETPGYKAKFTTFEEELKRSIGNGSAFKGSELGQRISGSRTFIKTSNSESARLDGNNVNTDVESGELVRAVMQYQQTVQAFNGEVSRLRSVLK